MNGTTSYSTINGRLPQQQLQQQQQQLQNGPSSPVLVLEPVNSTFAMKSLELPDQTKVKIGRQTGVTTAPHPSNGYFDSKVLSRVHAEVWSDGGKIFIRDLKSSNGTFLNGKRLCAENTESEPFELSQGDNLEFGIDILDENGALLHEKVSCKIYISRKSISNPGGSTQDATGKQKSVSPSGSGVNSGKATMASGAATPATIQQQQHGGLSENIDLILSRLQNELTRSQETYADLGFLKHGLHELEKVFVVTTSTAEPDEEEDGPTSQNDQTVPTTNGVHVVAPTQPSQGHHVPPFQVATGSANNHSNHSNSNGDYDRSQQDQARAQEISRLTKALEEATAELGMHIERIQILERQQDQDRQLLEQERQQHLRTQSEADQTQEQLEQLKSELDQISESQHQELESTLATLEASHKDAVDRLVLEADQEHEILAGKLRSAHAEALSTLETSRAKERKALEDELILLKGQLQALQEEQDQKSKAADDIVAEKEDLKKQLDTAQEELAMALKEVQELKEGRQEPQQQLRQRLSPQDKDSGDLETLTPTLSLLEDTSSTATAAVGSNGTAKSKVNTSSLDGIAATALAQDGGAESDFRYEFSWSQFAFPIGKRNQPFTNQPSTLVLSGGFMLVGLGVYALWHKAGMPGI
ncbi:hypothetical protein BGZ83_004925 [Gryganskiella cystojenkinii]|nr:hypothetical protein BGZ83_004925 [Gryganskiella cystojenkinii]